MSISAPLRLAGAPLPTRTLLGPGNARQRTSASPVRRREFTDSSAVELRDFVLPNRTFEVRAGHAARRRMVAGNLPICQLLRASMPRWFVAHGRPVSRQGRKRAPDPNAVLAIGCSGSTSARIWTNSHAADRKLSRLALENNRSRCQTSCALPHTHFHQYKHPFCVITVTPGAKTGTRLGSTSWPRHVHTVATISTSSYKHEP